MNKDKKDKITFKDLWRNPFYNSLFKLALWGLFFLFIFVIVYIGSLKISHYDSKDKDNKEIKKVTFTQMKNNLLNNSSNIVYTIGNFYITGLVNDNVLEATVETDTDEIYKIKYDGENLYQIKKSNEEINNELLGNINLNYLLPSKVFKITEDPLVILEKSPDEKTYNYNLDNLRIAVTIGETRIDEINIIENDINYNLKFIIKDQDADK